MHDGAPVTPYGDGNVTSLDDVMAWPNDTTMNGTDDDDSMLELLGALAVPSETNYWCLLLLVFPVLTVFGNVLVCLSVYNEKALHTVTNYFIVSLAIADIMVAILVMPLAVYVEVAGAVWRLGDALCDTWVAFDVMCCTSSILNLTAISVDRYIAVTRPIQYAKHRNSRRVHVTLALTWVVSIAVSSPIALGANYTERRAQTPWLCTFYNADFLIGSSMTSFYVPCLLMILLYWRTFRAISARACKMAANRTSSSPSVANRKSVVQQMAPLTGSGGAAAATSRPVVATVDDVICLDSLTMRNNDTTSNDDSDNDDDEIAASSKNAGNGNGARRVVVRVRNGGGDESAGMLAVTFGRVADYRTFHGGGGPANSSAAVTPTSPSVESPQPASGNGRLQPNTDDVNLAPTAAFVPVANARLTEQTTGCRNGSRRQQQQQQQRRRRRRRCLSTTPIQPMSIDGAEMDIVGECGSRNASNGERQSRRGGGRGVQVFDTDTAARSGGGSGGTGLRMRRSAVFGFSLQRFAATTQRHDSKLSTKRERKATKTLAIVLGVFLLCWVPFFSLNIINAVCIRDDLFETFSACNIHPMAFSLFVWLGYINSFLNPLIYTIFNIEFRKAFKKILLQPCQH